MHCRAMGTALEPAPYNDATVVLQLKVINDSLEGQTRQRKRDLCQFGSPNHRPCAD
jgi:hypothetical protein